MRTASSPDLSQGLPLVSVVIPTRNRFHLARRAVATALAQTVPVEIIVIDDASTDAVPGWVTTARVNFITRKERGGVAAARNDGLAAATADWIAFLDDDDLWSPDKLQQQLQSARENDATYAYSDAYVVSPEGVPRLYISPPEPAQLSSELLIHNALPSGASNVTVRRELLQNVGGFDTKLSYMADWDMWLRISSRARGAVVHRPLVAYLEHQRSMTCSQDYNFQAELGRMLSRHSSLMRDAAGRPHRGGIARFEANHALLAKQRWRSAMLFLIAAASDRNALDVARALLAITDGRTTRYARSLVAEVRGLSRTRAVAGMSRTVSPIRDARPAWLVQQLAPVFTSETE